MIGAKVEALFRLGIGLDHPSLLRRYGFKHILQGRLARPMTSISLVRPSMFSPSILIFRQGFGQGIKGMLGIVL